MANSPAMVARRALVTVLLSLASLYGVLLSVTRESTDDQVLAGYKKLIRKVHPDKKGKTEDAQRLLSAKNLWDTARKEAKKPGRPRNDGPRSSDATYDWEAAREAELADPEEIRKVYRIRAGAVMLTYNGIRDVAQWHKSKKVKVEEWAQAVRSGALTKAIKELSPIRARGPWEVLCDNEHFLASSVCQRGHARARVTLWSIPARSPDLNPVERFWAWLRRKLRSMDLADAIAKKPVLGRMAYRARVIRVLKTTKAQTAAANIAKGFRRTCKRIVDCKGAGVKG